MLYWLSINVWPFLIHGMAGTIGAAFAAGVIIAPFRAAFKKFHRAMDSLDPETDYGVTRQLRLINRAQEAGMHGKST